MFLRHEICIVQFQSGTSRLILRKIDKESSIWAWKQKRLTVPRSRIPCTRFVTSSTRFSGNWFMYHYNFRFNDMVLRVLLFGPLGFSVWWNGLSDVTSCFLEKGLECGFMFANNWESPIALSSTRCRSAHIQIPYCAIIIIPNSINYFGIPLMVMRP